MFTTAENKRSVLIVEDDQIWGNYYQHIVERLGFTAENCQTLPQALALMDSTRLRLVITSALNSDWRNIVNTGRAIDLPVTLITSDVSALVTAQKQHIPFIYKLDRDIEEKIGQAVE